MLCINSSRNLCESCLECGEARDWTTGTRKNTVVKMQWSLQWYDVLVCLVAVILPITWCFWSSSRSCYLSRMVYFQTSLSKFHLGAISLLLPTVIPCSALLLDSFGKLFSLTDTIMVVCILSGSTHFFTTIKIVRPTLKQVYPCAGAPRLAEAFQSPN